MARITLTTPGEDVFAGGDDIEVFGTTSGGEVITVIEGSDVVLDASFAAGGDVVALAGEAEDYTAVLVGSRVILTNAAGTTVSIPVGTEGIAVAFGDDDTRVLAIVDGAVVIGDQTITGDEATLEPGMEGENALQVALANLAAAEAAQAAFLDAQPESSDTPEEIRANAADSQARLAAARDANGSLSRLQAEVDAEVADVVAVQAEIDTIPGLDAAIDDLLQESADLAAAQAAFVAALAQRNAAEAAYEANFEDIRFDAEGQVFEVDDGTPIIVLNANDQLVFASAAAAGRIGAQDLLVATRAYQAEFEDLQQAEEDFDEAEAEVGSFARGPELLVELIEERADVVVAQNAVAARQTLLAEVNAEQALVNQLEEFEDDVEDAQDAVTALGFEQPITVNDGDFENATDGNDIFVLASNDDGFATISDFGDEGEDILFVGGNTYTVVRLGDTADIDNSAQGDAGVLEVFIQQQGDDTVLFFEDETFSGSTSNGAFQGFEVTLLDTDADQVVLGGTGNVTIEPTVDMAMIPENSNIA